MTQEEAIQKIMDELMINNVVLVFNPHILGTYMEWLYTIGYEEGSKSRSNEVPVIQMDLNGEILMEWKSIAEASRRNGSMDKSSIVNVCKGTQHTAGGYLWKYKV